MAITTTTNKASYSGSIGTGPYDLAVRVLDEDDVKVYVKVVATGVQTLLAKTTNYTIAAISGDYDNGARVTTVTTYTSDYEIILIREVDYDQGLDLVNGGDLDSDALEDALDNTVMQTQQLDERLDRTITAPVSDVSGLDYSIGSVVDRASKVLGFDTSGNVTQVALTETGSFGVDTNTGLSIASNIVSNNVDDVSIEFDSTDSYKFSVKALGIDTAELAADAVTAAKIEADAVTTAKILDDNVTYAKVQNVSATAKLLGRTTAGAGVIEEVPLLLSTDGASTSETSVMSEKRAKAYTDSKGIIQMVNTQDGAMTTSTPTVIPNDNTIPQITEGLLVMSQAITPTSATTNLRIDVVVMGSTVGARPVVALFQDSTADALACCALEDGGGKTNIFSFTHFMTSGTTSSTTFKVNLGTQSGAVTFNGDGAAALYGGTLASSITITEVNV
jgi:hypothetical protein